MIDLNFFSNINTLLTPSQRKELNIFVLLFFFAMILETLGIGLVIPILNILSQENINFSNYPFLSEINLDEFSKIEIIVISMAVLLCLYTIKAIFLSFIAYKEANFLTDIRTTLSKKFFSIYLNKSYSFHLQTNSAQLVRNINDIRWVMVCVRSYMMLFIESIVVLGIVTLLLIYEPYGAICSTIFLGSLGIFFYKRIQKRASRWGKERQLREGFRMMHLQQGFGAVKEIKVLGRESKFINEFYNENLQAAISEKKQTFVLSLPRLWLEWLTISGIILLIFVMMNQNRDFSSFVPTLGLFMAAAYRLTPSITKLMNCIQQINYGSPVIKTYSNELKNIQTNESPTKGNNDQIIIKDFIEIKKINFKYPKSEKILFSNLDFKIKCGESIGFVGESGIGKTTLINIMLGLLKPDSGDILSNGKTIYGGIRSWQDQLGYVTQHTYLTDDSLKNNIAFGLYEEEINNELISKALASAQLTKFVNSLRNGLDTKIGEFGERLSGGQRQRIGIARALYNSPKILILDESTNSLDRDTEKAIIDEVHLAKEKKTIIMISHSLKTLSRCDVIFNISEKGIEKLGNKEQ